MAKNRRFTGLNIDRDILPYTIEKNIPLPVRVGGKWGKGYLATFRKMKPGDSVVLPIKSRNNISAQARKIFGSGNWTARKEKDGWRIWRTG